MTVRQKNKTSLPIRKIQQDTCLDKLEGPANAETTFDSIVQISTRLRKKQIKLQNNVSSVIDSSNFGNHISRF